LQHHLLAEGDDSPPHLLAADHLGYQDRQREVLPGHPECTALLAPRLAVFEDVLRRVTQDGAVVARRGGFPVDLTQVLAEATMPRQHLRQPECNLPLSPVDPLGKTGPDGPDATNSPDDTPSRRLLSTTPPPLGRVVPSAPMRVSHPV